MLDTVRAASQLTVSVWELDAKFFQGLADPTRVRILAQLLEGEKHVSELVSRLQMSQSRVSMHLTCLRNCGLVVTRKEGRYVFYQVGDTRVRDLLRLAGEVIADHAAQILACQITEES